MGIVSGLEESVQPDGAIHYAGSEKSSCHIVRYENVGLKLDADIHSGSDGVRVRLCEALRPNIMAHGCYL